MNLAAERDWDKIFFTLAFFHYFKPSGPVIHMLNNMALISRGVFAYVKKTPCFQWLIWVRVRGVALSGVIDTSESDSAMSRKAVLLTPLSQTPWCHAKRCYWYHSMESHFAVTLTPRSKKIIHIIFKGFFLCFSFTKFFVSWLKPIRPLIRWKKKNLSLIF